jgi:hypothetical protein
MLCLGGAETDTGSQRPSREWADVGACASKVAIIPRPMLLGPGKIEVEGVGDTNHPHSRLCSLNVHWCQTHTYSHLPATITTHIKGRLRTRLRSEQCQTWPTLANGGQKYPGVDIKPRDVGGRLLTDYRLTVTTLSTLFIFFVVVMTSPDFQVAGQPENYAKTLLINSFPLAIAFTLIYVPLLGLFVFKAVKNPTYVLWITAFFCQGWLIPRTFLGPGG